MVAFCLPKEFATKFLNALRDGTLAPDKLRDMTSDERRTAFAGLLGDDNAKEVNALFESKLLLKDQQRGMVTWARKVSGLSEAAKTDIVSRIMRMDRVLQPAEERAFLADLAEQKLGVSVTADEAKSIFDLSSVAAAKRAEMLKDVGNVDNRIAYGRAVMDLTDRIESLKPNHRSFWDRMIDILNIPKSALTSIFHFSAPFVQGWGMMSTQRAWQGFGQMFRYFKDEENYKNLNAYIISHPDYALAKDGKLGLTKLGDKLSAREEAIQSTLVEQANTWLSDKTGIPNLVRASSRAFTGYLNYVRFNRFADLLTAARLAGEDVKEGSPAVRDLAKVVNDFTGRGAIGPGDKYASVAPALNVGFFSPRKISATMAMFNPYTYLNPSMSHTARMAAIRQLSGSLIGTTAVLGLAKAMGAEVDPDPRSANFAKIQIGGEKLDMTGGNAIYLRLLARLATNQEITAEGHLINLGEGYKPTTRADLLMQYIRGKLSPIAGGFADALYGTDPVGRPFSLTQEARDKLMPITIGSFINFAMNDPDNTAAMIPSLAAIFGVGLESPLPPLTKSGRDVWGMPEGTLSHAASDPVDQELNHLGYTPNFPPEKIKGVKLTDAQYDDYLKTAGPLARVRIESLMRDPRWSRLPDADRLDLVKQNIRQSRSIAATAVELRAKGTANDISRQATDAKLARIAHQNALAGIQSTAASATLH
jgi:hypothetical protein